MTLNRWNRALVAGVACVLLCAVAAPAAPLTEEERCAKKKLTAQTQHVNRTMKCHTRTGLTGPADEECKQTATGKLENAFGRAETPGECMVNGDAPTIVVENEAFVETVVQVLDPGPTATEAEQKCAVKKAKAATASNRRSTGCEKRDLARRDEVQLDACREAAEGVVDTRFERAEAPGECATSGDAAVVKQEVEAHVTNIAQALVPPPAATATPTVTITPTTAPTETPTVAAGLVDNGDGTITDNDSGLMWEKKDQSGGIHDVDNFYTWSHLLSPSLETGTAFLDLLATLNTAPCFAGHCDWRLPTIAELATLYPVPGAFNSGCTAGCSATACSCTDLFTPYWSSETYFEDQFWAHAFNFEFGFSSTFEKINARKARAVRP